MPASQLRLALAAPAALLLAGCEASNYMVLFPAGWVGEAQADLIILTVILMAFVFVPVVTFTLYFAWRYRARNTKSSYSPKWDHSKLLEVFLWGGPIVLIAIIGTVTWITTHALDPYDAIQPEAEPLEVHAIAMDWKWLFVYPKYDVASVGELALPVDKPVELYLTSATAMTAFMVPALGSQIFAMSGMATNLHLLPLEVGNYLGRNYQYNGAGFHGMVFSTKVMPPAEFEEWVAKVKTKGERLDTERYMDLAEPSNPKGAVYFSPVRDRLYRYVIGLFHNGQPIEKIMDIGKPKHNG